MDKQSFAIGMNVGGSLLQQGFGGLDIDSFVAGFKAAWNAKKDGEAFLATIAKDPQVKKTKSGLMYKVLSEGSGRKPKASDTVRCHYEGTFPDGGIFDSSYKRGEPAEFPLDGVIKGWTEALQLMSEGSKYELYLPYSLAYGERGAGSSIPPYSALKFIVELIKVL